MKNKKRLEKSKQKRKLKAASARRYHQSLKKAEPKRVAVAGSQQPVNELKNRVILRDAGVMIHLPNPAHSGDKSFLANRGGIMWSPRTRATYHELLFENLNRTLGRDWIERQEKLPESEKHFIYKCFNQLDAYIKSGGIKTQNEPGNYKSSAPNGYVQSLITLAFDVYILQYVGALDEKVLNRLKNKDQYQGARYEVSVAAIFARAGWTIEWLEDKEKGVKIPEFIATSPDGKRKVAVEAKSRHRVGVIHRNGIFDPNDAREGQMLYLYKSAVEKDTQNIPMAIFLDLNAPHNIATEDEAHWRDDLIQMIDAAEPDRDEDSIDPYNVLISTNYAPHYDGIEESLGGQTVICKPTKTKYQLEDEYIWSIWEAAGKYQRVPNLIPLRYP